MASLAACGGGGGSSSSPVPPGGGSTATPTPTATPVATGSPVANGVSLLTATSGTFTARVAASAADELVLAQEPTTPTEPPSSGSLTQYTVTVSETAGATGSSVARNPASASRAAALAQRIRENHALDAVDGFREKTFPAAALREQFRGLTATPLRSPQSTRTTRAAQGTVGTQRSFKIITSTIGNSGSCAGGSTQGTYICNVTITATLEAAGAHGNIWV
ncbi:MAG: hypothetical protein JO103_12460, partial [Candidatus Eremiobacteraeota bacterium]|nr:hypothetical protein [Candidatus Eremiobacteraeota bacterium]